MTTVSNAAMNTDIQTLLLFNGYRASVFQCFESLLSILFDKYSEVELLDHYLVVILFLILGESPFCFP